VFAAVHLLKIDQFPFYGGQITNMFNAEQTQLGFSLLYRNNETPFIGGQFFFYQLHKSRAGLNQVF